MADIQRRETKGNPNKNPGIPPLFLPYMIKNKARYLLAGKWMILKWAVHSVNVTAAKVQK